MDDLNYTWILLWLMAQTYRSQRGHMRSQVIHQVSSKQPFNTRYCQGFTFVPQGFIPVPQHSMQRPRWMGRSSFSPVPPALEPGAATAQRHSRRWQYFIPANVSHAYRSDPDNPWSTGFIWAGMKILLISRIVSSPPDSWHASHVV